MHRCKFTVAPNDTVFICLFTLFCVWTSGTVLTLVVFFLTSILVSLYVFSIPKIKVFPVWTTHNSVFTNWKIYRSEWIFTILPVSSLFLEHGEFHILFHSMLFTKDVIVVRTISGICHWILRIKAICSIKLVHQRNKTIHVWAILIYINNSNVFIRNTNLHIVSWKQLVISHIVRLDPHKSGWMICLWVAVAFLPTDFDFFHVFF